MELARRGKYLLLPLSGEHIVAVDGGTTARFSDVAGSTLEIRGEMTVRFGPDPSTPRRTRDSGPPLTQLIGVPIRAARAHPRRGELLISFEDGSELVVEDGPYENWHYTKIDPARRADVLRVHGGAGMTSY
jgi:uncharacterized protein DUF6188